MSDPITAILAHYVNSGLTASSEYSEFELAADQLMQQVDALVDEIDQLQLSDLEESPVYTRKAAELDESGKLDLELGLNNFLVVIRNKKANYEPFFLHFKGLMRQASPPLEAYKPVGHTSTDIKPSSKSYSLLF